MLPGTIRAAGADFVDSPTSSTFTYDDSNDAVRPLSPDSAKAMKEGFVMSKSPTWAIVQSLIIPGLGQVYNHDYWKAPLFFGGAAALVWNIIINEDSNAVWRHKYNIATNSTDKEKANIYKEYYRDKRDKYGFYLLGVYLLCSIDAYVGAHLYDFDVSDDKLSFSITPNSYYGVSFNLQVKF